MRYIDSRFTYLLTCLLCREVGGAEVQEIAPHNVPATQLKDRSRSSSSSSGTRSRSPVRMSDEEHRRRRSRSSSRSSGSKSSSRSSSANRSRSEERHSRSPSEEVKRVSGDDVVESAAVKLESQVPTKEISEEHDNTRHSSSDKDDNHQEPMETTKKVCKLICNIPLQFLSVQCNVQHWTEYKITLASVQCPSIRPVSVHPATTANIVSSVLDRTSPNLEHSFP